MNCLEYRRSIGAEPWRTDAELEAHARSCAACAEFGAQMRQLDARIESALRIPVPLWSSIGSLTERWPRAPLALAASLLLAVTVAAILWLALPRSSLADEVIAHMQHEPEALHASVPLAPSAVAEVLAKSQMRLRAPLGRVTYASSCLFRGHLVPHLVIDAGRGPVTVMLLSDERVARPLHFSEQGFTGVIVPAQRGAIAVLTWDESQVAAIAARLSQSVE